MEGEHLAKGVFVSYSPSNISDY